jgi:hypothetical protein
MSGKSPSRLARTQRLRMTASGYGDFPLSNPKRTDQAYVDHVRPGFGREDATLCRGFLLLLRQGKFDEPGEQTTTAPLLG